MSLARIVGVTVTVGTVTASEVYRRGFIAPIGYGLRCWARALHWRAETEADPIA